MSEQTYTKSPWFNTVVNPPEREGEYEVVRFIQQSMLWEIPPENAKGELMKWPKDNFNWPFQQWKTGRVSIGGNLIHYWWRGIVYDTH